MKTLASYLGVLISLGVGASLAQAQNPYPYPVRQQPVYCPVPPLQAPDMRGACYYPGNCWGQPVGPNLNVYPSFPPFQGMIPLPGCPGSPAQVRFQSHPYARSPRDFFMVD